MTWVKDIENKWSFNDGTNEGSIVQKNNVVSISYNDGTLDVPVALWNEFKSFNILNDDSTLETLAKLVGKNLPTTTQGANLISSVVTHIKSLK